MVYTNVWNRWLFYVTQIWIFNLLALLFLRFESVKLRAQYALRPKSIICPQRALEFPTYPYSMRSKRGYVTQVIYKLRTELSLYAKIYISGNIQSYFQKNSEKYGSALTKWHNVLTAHLSTLIKSYFNNNGN